MPTAQLVRKKTSALLFDNVTNNLNHTPVTNLMNLEDIN